MTNVLVFDPADLPTGEQVEVVLVPGNQLTKLRAVSSPGGAGGGVVSVTGSDPIAITGTPTAPNVTILPASESDAGSMSAADKVKLDGLPAQAWPVTSPISPGITNPQLGQGQQTVPNATPPDVIIYATDAAAGSNDPGGRVVLMTGLPDGTAAPERFLIVQPTTTGTPEAKLLTAKILLQGLFSGPPTQVSSVGVGEPTGVGTQLVLNSVPNGRNSLVSHGVIQMSALDNATAGQSNWILWDATNLLPGAATLTYDVNTGGSQDDTGIYLQRRNGSVGPGTGVHSYIKLANGGTGEGDGTRQLAIEQLSNQPSIAFYDPTGLITANESAWIRLPNGNSGSSQGVIVARDVANDADWEIISFHFGQLHWGTGLVDNRYNAASQHLFQFSGTAPATANFRINNTVGDVPFAVLNDGFRSIVQGGTASWPPVGKDANRRWEGNANTNTTGSQSILTITITDNAITTLEITLQARDSTNTDFACFKHIWSYGKAGGTITVGAGTQPAAVDVNHTAAAVGIAPQFSVSGGNVLLMVNPWTTNLVHWSIDVLETANLGTF